MDTRTGDIKFWKDLTDGEKNSGWFKEIKTELTPLQLKNMKIGRNDPCGCGSSKKFKKCCWTGRFDSIQDDSIAEEMIQDQLDKY